MYKPICSMHDSMFALRLHDDFLVAGALHAVSMYDFVQ
jgi:hypothetical protein